MATEEQNKNSLYLMAIGAVGIVYGDIGTSPLYAIKECFSHGHYLTTADNILGIISLIFWSIMIIVTFKYAFLIMRADNHGEGGILALSALSLRKLKSGHKKIALGFGLLGGALFFGDGVITPAISVLSALEGIVLVSPGVSHWVLPMAIVVLIFLFATQKHGTAIIGNFFGPIMMIWFFVIAFLGGIQIIKTPSIIMALNPWYAVKFLGTNGWNGFVGLGSVILAVTGAEALYADMGHFGRNPIAKSWYFFILPSLVLSYFGQGAAILHDPAVATNPFYGIVPPDFLIPMIVLSTVATVIASQSVISGMFSLTWQAVQMGYLPRMHIIHTSSNQIGQIFVPMMNFCMFFCTLGLVLAFKNSDSLASAYGFSVICIMMITTSLTIIVAKDQWEWSLQKIIAVFSVFVIVDFTFFVANAIKILDGGWIPILLACSLYVIMTTWIKGRIILMEQIKGDTGSLTDFLESLQKPKTPRVAGVGVYMTGTLDSVPNSLVVMRRHARSLHKKVVLLSLVTSDVPRVHRSERLKVNDLGDGFYQVIGTYGFKEQPNVTALLERCAQFDLNINMAETSFFLSRGIPMLAMRSKMMRWQEELFIFLARNAMNATEFFKIPYNRVVELGIRFRI